MTPTDFLSAILLIAGGVFFLAGTVGLLRFPDVYTRLHALTKADNVGLGLVVMGLAMQVDAWSTVGKLLLIWALVLLAGARRKWGQVLQLQMHLCCIARPDPSCV